MENNNLKLKSEKITDYQNRNGKNFKKIEKVYTSPHGELVETEKFSMDVENPHVGNITLHQIYTAHGVYPIKERYSVKDFKDAIDLYDENVLKLGQKYEFTYRDRGIGATEIYAKGAVFSKTAIYIDRNCGQINTYEKIIEMKKETV
jgi:hypothetical protein